MPTQLEKLRTAYESAKARAKVDLISDATSAAILDLAVLSVRFLSNGCSAVQLKSLVPGKQYISFAARDNEAVISRPANTSLITMDEKIITEGFQNWRSDAAPDRNHLERMAYTLALAPCLAFEVFDRQNKKAPATYFEVVIGHLFAKAFKANPVQKATLEVMGKKMRMTMDYLFPPQGHRAGIHLPVKMSTRERVVQAWAHQRLLDAAYGAGAYRGIMVLFSETKLSLKTHEVVEICVPDQWIIYQSLLAKMERIYYFDMPDRYGELTKKYPELIKIQRFGDFFAEIEGVLHG